MTWFEPLIWPVTMAGAACLDYALLWFALYGAYSVNPYGIRRDSDAPSRGRMDSRTTSATGLASSRGTRLFGKAVCAVAALGIASGLAAWTTGFDLSEWI